MAYRRKGQRSKLLDLAKKSRERAQARRAAKAKRVGGKKYVTPLPKKKKVTAKKKVTPKKPEMKGPEFYRRKQTPKRKTSVSAATPTRKPHRTATQRAADKKELLAKQKTLRKESAGMRHGSEFKIPGLSKKDREGMEESVKLGSGGGLVKLGVGAGLTALGLKGHKMYKVKKAKDLTSGKTGGTSAGIGSTRAGSALSRTSGLGKAKGTPKKKTASKKSGPSKLLSSILKKAADFGKPKSAFSKLKKTQRRYPK